MERGRFCRGTPFQCPMLINVDGKSFVFDSGPDFRQQILRELITKLDALVFTHEHKDHVAGFDDIRAFNFFQGQSIFIYANEMTMKELKREFQYAFAEHKYPGVPDMNLVTITQEPFLIGDIPVTPVIVWHLNMQVYGFRFGKFTYITDANRIEEEERLKIIGSDTIVLNALRKEKHISHFNLDEATEVVRQLKIPNAYFTHISHQLGRHQAVEEHLPPGMHLAYDKLTLHF